MTRRFWIRPWCTAALAALAGALLAPAALAQFPPPGPGGPPPFGAPGGFPGRPPFALGKVTAVDSSAGTVTITPQFGGDSQVLHVAADAAITTRAAGTAADLKTGDSIQASSSGSGLTILLGQSAGFPGPGGPGGGGRGFRPGGPGGQAPASSLVVRGTIRSTSPLVVAVGTDATVTLRLSSTTKITKNVTLPLSGIKVGDTVAARGQAGDDGSFSAESVTVNPDLGGFGGRGFGGPGRGPRPGFGGPGPGFGPGAPPPGPPPGDGNPQ